MCRNVQMDRSRYQISTLYFKTSSGKYSLDFILFLYHFVNTLLLASRIRNRIRESQKRETQNSTIPAISASQTIQIGRNRRRRR